MWASARSSGTNPQRYSSSPFNFTFDHTFCVIRFLGSHGLCPHFYNSAFTNDFYATDSFSRCGSRRLARNVPALFKMGYMETRKRWRWTFLSLFLFFGNWLKHFSMVYGDLVSPTGECYPYNNYSAASLDHGFGRLMRLRKSRQNSRHLGPKCSENWDWVNCDNFKVFCNKSSVGWL